MFDEELVGGPVGASVPMGMGGPEAVFMCEQVGCGCRNVVIGVLEVCVTGGKSTAEDMAAADDTARIL